MMADGRHIGKRGKCYNSPISVDRFGRPPYWKSLLGHHKYAAILRFQWNFEWGSNFCSFRCVIRH